MKFEKYLITEKRTLLKDLKLGTKLLQKKPKGEFKVVRVNVKKGEAEIRDMDTGEIATIVQAELDDLLTVVK